MDGSQLQPQHLVHLDQVMQVSLAVACVDCRMCIRVNRREVVLPFLITHIDRTETGKQLPVASVACRHDTVEHIDAPFDRFEDVDRCTDTHQVAGFVFR